jgi:hypothetical protein
MIENGSCCDETKICHTCGSCKPLNYFSRDRHKRDGRCTKCKSCVSDYHQKNRGKIQLRELRYCEENKERLLEYHRNRKGVRHSYYLENKEKISQRNSEWNFKHKDQEKRRKALYYAEHKEDISKKQAENYQKRKTVVAERRLIFNKNVVSYMGGSCANCGLVTDFYEVYHCHHRNPGEKSFQVSAMVSKPWDLVTHELDKCVLLCNECHNVTTQQIARAKTRSSDALRKAQRRDRRKERCVNYLGGKCQICGRMHEDLAKYEFHHVDPNTKEFSIAPNILKPWAILKTELDKCVLLDANCHASTKVGRYKDVVLVPGQVE